MSKFKSFLNKIFAAGIDPDKIGTFDDNSPTSDINPDKSKIFEDKELLNKFKDIFNNLFNNIQDLYSSEVDNIDVDELISKINLDDILIKIQNGKIKIHDYRKIKADYVINTPIDVLKKNKYINISTIINMIESDDIYKIIVFNQLITVDKLKDIYPRIADSLKAIYNLDMDYFLRDKKSDLHKHYFKLLFKKVIFKSISLMKSEYIKLLGAKIKKKIAGDTMKTKLNTFNTEYDYYTDIQKAKTKEFNKSFNALKNLLENGVELNLQRFLDFTGIFMDLYANNIKSLYAFFNEQELNLKEKNITNWYNLLHPVFLQSSYFYNIPYNEITDEEKKNFLDKVNSAYDKLSYDIKNTLYKLKVISDDYADLPVRTNYNIIGLGKGL